MLIKGSFGIAQLTSEVAFFGFGSMSSLISETNVVFSKKHLVEYLPARAKRSRRT